jgi:hypothetical protein
MERGKVGVSSLVLGILILTLILFFSGEKSPSVVEKKSDHNPLCDGKICRPTEYCFLDRSQGSEGNNSGVSSSWRLAHVVINIRHGDRTSIHRLGENPKCNTDATLTLA